MKKSILICTIIMILSLCMAFMSSCETGGSGNSGNRPSSERESLTDSTEPDRSESYDDSKESDDVKESDKPSESESNSEAASEGESESAHTHAFARVVDKRFLKSEATCTKKAEYYFSCKCGAISSQTFEDGEMLPHTVVIDEAIKPTCLVAGYTEGKHCSVCDKIIVEQKLIPATGHDLISHEGKPSTCTEKGYAAYETCRFCDYTTYRELPLAEHELENGICKNCGKEITPHTHVEVVDKGTPATCLEQGLTDGKHCSICNKVLVAQETIPALGHDIVNHDGKAATCTESGYKAYETCSRCDYTTYEAISALGHDLTRHESKPATCTEVGYDAYETCSRCTYTTYSEIPALGHDIINHDGKAATCTESGYKAYKTCSRCDYTTYEAISALGHNYENGTCTRCGVKHNDHNMSLDEEKAATCTESGYKKYSCTVCGIKKTEEISALGHDLVLHNATPATCTEEGCEVYEFCSRCDYTTDKVVIPALGHDLVSHEGKAATCNESGWEDYETCTRCSYTTYKTITALGHEYKNGKCIRCGTADGAPYSREGDYIYFGSYPQTKVSDEELIATLNNSAGELPTSENAYAWTSYGYYISGSVQDYMWYKDETYNGSKYRGVYFTSYRPYYCGNDSDKNNTWQDDNGYYVSTVYWFKYEGIKWRILTESNGRAFLMCDMAIDSQQYYHTTDSRTVDDKTVYANNYAESEIRKWLNETFYNTAFNEMQKAIIKTMNVDNSAKSTNPYNNSSCWNNGENEYACENTNDKIFLLSESEVTNPAYGFSSDTGWDSTRRLKSSDYAKSQGCWQYTDSGYNGNCWWWLRSPDCGNSRGAGGVYNVGNSDYNDYNVNYAYGGVVPALWIAL